MSQQPEKFFVEKKSDLEKIDYEASPLARAYSPLVVARGEVLQIQKDSDRTAFFLSQSKQSASFEDIKHYFDAKGKPQAYLAYRQELQNSLYFEARAGKFFSKNNQEKINYQLGRQGKTKIFFGEDAQGNVELSSCGSGLIFIPTVYKEDGLSENKLSLVIPGTFTFRFKLTDKGYELVEKTPVSFSNSLLEALFWDVNKIPTQEEINEVLSQESEENQYDYYRFFLEDLIGKQEEFFDKYEADYKNHLINTIAFLKKHYPETEAIKTLFNKDLSFQSNLATLIQKCRQDFSSTETKNIKDFLAIFEKNNPQGLKGLLLTEGYYLKARSDLVNDPVYAYRKGSLADDFGYYCGLESKIPSQTDLLSLPSRSFLVVQTQDSDNRDKYLKQYYKINEQGQAEPLKEKDLKNTPIFLSIGKEEAEVLKKLLPDRPEIQAMAVNPKKAMHTFSITAEHVLEIQKILLKKSEVEEKEDVCALKELVDYEFEQLKEILGQTFGKIWSIGQEKDYKTLTFNQKEILNIKTTLEAVSSKDKKKAKNILDKLYEGEAKTLHRRLVAQSQDQTILLASRQFVEEDKSLVVKALLEQRKEVPQPFTHACERQEEIENDFERGTFFIDDEKIKTVDVLKAELDRKGAQKAYENYTQSVNNFYYFTHFVKEPYSISRHRSSLYFYTSDKLISLTSCTHTVFINNPTAEKAREALIIIPGSINYYYKLTDKGYQLREDFPITFSNPLLEKMFKADTAFIPTQEEIEEVLKEETLENQCDYYKLGLKELIRDKYNGYKGIEDYRLDFLLKTFVFLDKHHDNDSLKNIFEQDTVFIENLKELITKMGDFSKFPLETQSHLLVLAGKSPLFHDILHASWDYLGKGELKAEIGMLIQKHKPEKLSALQKIDIERYQQWKKKGQYPDLKKTVRSLLVDKKITYEDCFAIGQTGLSDKDKQAILQEGLKFVLGQEEMDLQPLADVSPQYPKVIEALKKITAKKPFNLLDSRHYTAWIYKRALTTLALMKLQENKNKPNVASAVNATDNVEQSAGRSLKKARQEAFESIYEKHPLKGSPETVQKNILKRLKKGFILLGIAIKEEELKFKKIKEKGHTKEGENKGEMYCLTIDIKKHGFDLKEADYCKYLTNDVKNMPSEKENKDMEATKKILADLSVTKISEEKKSFETFFKEIKPSVVIDVSFKNSENKAVNLDYALGISFGNEEIFESKNDLLTLMRKVVFSYGTLPENFMQSLEKHLKNLSEQNLYERPEGFIEIPETLLEPLYALLQDSNSTGIQTIEALLLQKGSLLDFREITDIVQKRLLVNQAYVHSTLFGEGREPWVEYFYRKIDHLGEEKDSEKLKGKLETIIKTATAMKEKPWLPASEKANLEDKKKEGERKNLTLKINSSPGDHLEG